MISGTEHLDKLIQLTYLDPLEFTYSAGEYGFIVNVALDPAHQVFDVRGCSHLGRSLEVL